MELTAVTEPDTCLPFRHTGHPYCPVLYKDSILCGCVDSDLDQEKGGWPRVVGPASARKESEAARLEDRALASVAPYALLPTMKSYGDQEQVTSGGCKQGGDRES